MTIVFFQMATTMAGITATEVVATLLLMQGCKVRHDFTAGQATPPPNALSQYIYIARQMFWTEMERGGEEHVSVKWDFAIPGC